jgi:alanyl-tRNA synthetase
MTPLTSAEIRERFLRYYEERGHARMPSDSLVPRDDPTLLFTGAGMNQFKDMFLGKGALPHKRVTTAQKCLRVPDLDNVGRTPRHHTFFEMLGHFSFGDYFKKECIAWEWGFFTEALGIPPEQLVVTIYHDDEEAFEIWTKDIGLAPEKVFRFGEKENFWPAEAPSKGPNGPCGPCSEIYFDNAPGKPYPDKEGLVELPDDRFTEIGNCVFTQFDRQADGTLAPLPQRNIDVGLGLERITAVLAGAKNNFETDLFRPYIERIGQFAGKRYGEDPADDERLRRIADHVRAVVFCIADGALPGNEGRGYVVRKIIRRAVRDGYELGIEGSFLHELVATVGDVMGEAYPEVREHAGQCRGLIQSEEASFRQVYEQGRARLADYLGRVAAPQRAGDLPVLAGSGEFAFQLHDTYGFPIDITRQALRDAGFALDEAGFEAEMEAQRERARAASATSDAVFAENLSMAMHSRGVPATRFVGYEQLEVDDRVLGLVDEGGQPIERLVASDTPVRAQLVVGTTPFYAQGGGQLGDRGEVRGPSGRARVVTTRPQGGYSAHEIELVEGSLAVGDEVHLTVDREARHATERNHTATHLLHAALKNVLGAHVAQAGSEVSPERLRFDFTHGERLTSEQIAAIEDQVESVVRSATAVVPEIKPLQEARKAGFVAMFGEKYGDEVRTLRVGEFSKELCGGTHVANSGHIGAFRIVSDAAVSAGTRRIEAVTGPRAIAEGRAEHELLVEIARRLKTPVPELSERIDALVEESKRLRRELEKATAADVGKLAGDLAAAVVERGGVRTVVFRTGALQMKELQDLLTRSRQALEPFAGVVLAVGPEEVLVGCAVSKPLIDRLKAGDVVKQVVGVLGGGGGGRPELAQGKGKNPAKADEAAALAGDLLATFG